jgi:hypothetical protein
MAWVDLQVRPHALYRFFGAGGTLLYIGITADLPTRLHDHRDDKPWWLGVTNVTLEHYPSRDAVLEAERRAIVAERPLCNNHHNEAGRVKPSKPEPETAMGVDELADYALQQVLTPNERWLAMDDAENREYRCGRRRKSCCYVNGACCNHCTIHVPQAVAAARDALSEHAPAWADLTTWVKDLFEWASPEIVAAMRAAVTKYEASEKCRRLPPHWFEGQLDYAVWPMELLASVVQAVATTTRSANPSFSSAALDDIDCPF